MNLDRALMEVLRANRDVSLRPATAFAWSRQAEPTAGEAGEAARVRLVWADALLERGDPRGEQLLLEHIVEHRPDWPTWQDEAERLLELVCERGFVCIPEDPDAMLLAWRGSATNPYAFRSELDGQAWEVRYERRMLFVVCDRRTVFRAWVDLDWSDADINLYLHVIGDAVRARSSIVLPDANDPRRRPGRYPRYRVPGGGTVYARDISRWNAIYRRLK